MTENRKMILLVKPVLPYPPDQGTKVVSFRLIQTLLREFDVTVLARILSCQERVWASELEQTGARVVTILPANRRSLLHRAAYKVWYKLVSLLRGRSLKSLYDCPGAFVRAARELAGERFDLVIIEYWQLYPMLQVFPREKTVLLTHDIDLLVNRQSSLLERNLWRKIGKVRRWLREQKEEVYAYKSVDRVLALTPRDAEAVRAIAKTGLEVDVLPVGFDADSYAPGPEARDPNEVLFMGALSAGFNLDALEFFFSKIYPHLDEVPGIKFTVVGGALPKRLEYAGGLEGVDVVGHVSDIRPYLNRAACLVIPLRYGGGLRIRILEAMMAGLPVVCTPVAIAGMDFQAGVEFLLAESPEDFASEVKRLVEDPGLAAEIGLKGREAVIQRYSDRVQSEKALQLFRHIIDS